MNHSPRGFVLGDVPIAALTLAEAVQEVARLGAERKGAAVHLCNAYTLSLASRDLRYRELLRQGDLNLPDGAPVAWASRLSGGSPVSKPVRGPDLFRGVLQVGVQMGLRHYFYGGSPQTADALAAQLRECYPDVRVAGIESPPYRPLMPVEVQALALRIRQAQANIVWIGLGTPTQDVFVAEHRERLGCPLVAVGAAFDFVAGTRREAPKILQGTGLEWLFRLATEPRRLWRRYVFGNIVFLKMAAGSWMDARRRT